MGPEGAVNIVFRSELAGGRRPGRAARRADRRLQGPVREPVHGRRARLRGRRDPSLAHAPGADRRARDGAHEARRAPQAPARQHPVVSPRGGRAGGAAGAASRRRLRDAAVRLAPCADSPTAALRHDRRASRAQRPLGGQHARSRSGATRRSAGRARRTLLAIEGGPGYPTVGSAAYYLAMLGPARRTTALVLVDQRGTGQSELIDCAPLQDFPYAPFAPVALRPYRLAVGRCGAGSAAAATPTARVPPSTTWSTCSTRWASRAWTSTATPTARSRRRRSRCDTPGACARWCSTARTRSISTPGRAMRSRSCARALRGTCARSPTCPWHGADPVERVADARAAPARAPAASLVARPCGHAVHVRLDDRGLAGRARRGRPRPRHLPRLPGRGRGLRPRRPAPLARLAAEAFAGGANGPAIYYSAGLDAAVECHDYPQLFDTSAPPASASRRSSRGPRAPAGRCLLAVRPRDLVRRRSRELRLVRPLAASRHTPRSAAPARRRLSRPCRRSCSTATSTSARR